MNYDVIVVGAGHAGCEASIAAAKMGKKVLLITSNIKNIADLACNPSIGGSAKGIVAREIDALGGVMGKITDQALLQIKMLNYNKGAAVQALRAQVDKIVYPKKMTEEIEKHKNLTLIEGMVKKIIIENKKVIGIETEGNEKYYSKATILTTGTYLKSNILIGNKRIKEGPHGEKTSNYLSENLKELGFKILRLKTGTPPRIQKDSVDITRMKLEAGDNVYRKFSHNNKYYYKVEEQIPCYLTYTNEKTHQIINENIELSSMYGGIKDIKSIGARYCPSIEDKVKRFYTKDKHQLFIEPESIYLDEVYLQGLSTSLPHEIQEKMVKSIVGLENAVIKKYAYAIEYDAISSTDLKQNLETKIIENLFTAGQINGTSGYEEAAAQGIMAGINAVLKIENKEPFILKRNEAYIGVLIDDLITKGVKDPYRLLTSRAEYRLLLRHDNADLRLTDYGIKYGLIKNYENYINKKNDILELEKKLKETKITPTKEILNYLDEINTTPIKDSTTLYNLLKRQEINFEHLKRFIDKEYDESVISQVEVNNKYSGYIEKANKEAEKMIRLENKKIPKNINYDEIANIASEARQKLKEVRPTSIGQATRISGVNPADISILMIYLKKGEKNES
jgi:tRNA uridine 5-carboxymethylaminomethyl modification enzyme